MATVGLAFWILKIAMTTAGDVSGDILSETLGLGYILGLFAASGGTAALLAAKLCARRINPWLYWALILGSSAIGAELSDTLDRGLHLGYAAGAALLLFVLAICLLAGWRYAGRIAVDRIHTRTDEFFFWLSAIAANSLGSVLGDLCGDRLGLGLTGTLAINAGVLAALLVLHYATRRYDTLLFWTAFVFSRA